MCGSASPLKRGTRDKCSPTGWSFGGWNNQQTSISGAEGCILVYFKEACNWFITVIHCYSLLMLKTCLCYNIQWLIHARIYKPLGPFALEYHGLLYFINNATINNCCSLLALDLLSAYERIGHDSTKNNMFPFKLSQSWANKWCCFCGSVCLPVTVCSLALPMSPDIVHLKSVYPTNNFIQDSIFSTTAKSIHRILAHTCPHASIVSGL